MRTKVIGYVPTCGQSEIDWNGVWCANTVIEIDDGITDEEIVPDPDGDGVAPGIVWLVDWNGQIRIARGEPGEWEDFEAAGWDLLPDPCFV